MRRGLLATAFAALVLAVPAHASTRQDVTIYSTDGTPLAATLFLPSAAPPAGGWPAVVLMHGLAGERSSMTALAQRMGLVGERYAVLAYDARGHGASGGLIGIDGPAEIADARSVFDWLAARPDVADARIGAFGISYGGGAALGSLAAGTRWAAVEAAETWSDLGTALVPQGLAKSGVVAGFLTSLPQARLEPSLLTIRDAAFSGTDPAAVRAWTAQRTWLPRLRGSRTPVFLMQGRRDFAFGLDQAKRLYAVVRGPKRLWIGNHGHAPSSFPAADTPAMLAEGVRWLDRFVAGGAPGIERTKPVVLANEGRASVRRYGRLPTTRTIVYRGTVGATIGAEGSAIVRNPRLGRAVEIFGAPTVKVTADARGGWPRLVAVLTARTPAGRTIVVSGGGVPTRPGRRTYAIRLVDQATRVPKGARLEVTLAASSTAQDANNLLYLDLPSPPGARLALGAVEVAVPVLRP